MIPFYRTSVFWTALIGAIVSVGLAIGLDEHAIEAVASVAGIVISYCIAAGLITKEEVRATFTYEEGYRDGRLDAERAKE
jgi:hypothetical protein